MLRAAAWLKPQGRGMWGPQGAPDATVSAAALSWGKVTGSRCAQPSSAAASWARIGDTASMDTSLRGLAPQQRQAQVLC